MAYTETRINKLREYLFNIIDNMTLDDKYDINADWLGNVGDFSLDKIPTESTVEEWVIGTRIYRDVYSFRSRKSYSSNQINNLSNIGFFEDFENKIKSNNDEGILPDIKGIESIGCLNCGSLISVDGNEAIFDIQIQIIYRENEEDGGISL